MQDEKKVIWAYMLEHGYETTGEWNYYRSAWESIPNRDREKDYHQELKEKVLSIGVDWEKTKLPDSSIESGFTDTYHDSSKCEALLGVLYLKDGSEYIIGSRDKEGMGTYIEKLLSFIKSSDRVKSIFGE